MSEPVEDDDRQHDPEHLTTCERCWSVAFDPESDEVAEFIDGVRVE